MKKTDRDIELWEEPYKKKGIYKTSSSGDVEYETIERTPGHVKTTRVLSGSVFVKKFVNDGEVPLGGHKVSVGNMFEHVLIVGGTGAGKTQLLLPTVDYLLDRSKQGKAVVVVVDVGYNFSDEKGFYNPETDYILNPLDPRSVDWNPFCEIKKKSDCDLIASSIVKAPKGSESQDWADKARNLISGVLYALSFTEFVDKSPQTFFKCITQYSPNQLKTLLAGTGSMALFEEGNEKQMASVKSIAADSLKGFDYMNRNGKFGLRDWIRKAISGNEKRVLFLPYKEDSRETLLPFIAFWLDMIVKESLTLKPERGDDSGIFIIADEFASLRKMPALNAALTQGRKFGLSLTLALQAFSQLEKPEAYSKAEAEELISCLNTKILLKVTDETSCRYAEGLVGKQKIEVTETTRGRNGSPDTVRIGDTKEVSLVPGTNFSAIKKAPPTRGIALFSSIPRVAFRDFREVYKVFVPLQVYKKASPEVPKEFWPSRDLPDGQKRYQLEQKPQIETKKNNKITIAITAVAVLSACLIWLLTH
jgi:hypothetical protein